MSFELDLLKEMAAQVGYRFVVMSDGSEHVYRPDGSLAIVAKHETTTVPFIAPAEVPHRPEDVDQSPDGFWYRKSVGSSGVLMAQRVCEDCWQNLPPYINAKLGFVSPESDGKSTTVAIAGTNFQTSGVMPQQKSVCLPCFNLAFQRVYPGAPLPELSGELRDDLNNIMEWSATNVLPTVLRLDADDPMRRAH